MIDNMGREITYLRLSVTELCNLRCRYCMPQEGVCKKRHEDMLTEDEMIQAIEAATALGINKLRITGVEPLVKKNILSICRRAAAVSGIKEVCVTTNGIRLPKLAVPLREAGVSRLNISLDTLDEKKYAYITKQGELSDALNGVHAALDAGFEQIKINVVLMGGFNDDEIVALAELTKKYTLEVRFIELMPMLDEKEFGEYAYLPCSTVLKQLPEAVAQPQINGSVARLYRLPGAKSNIGLISPISEHFCSKCNRLRLTADGKIKPCLHSSQEFPIKGLSKARMEEAFKKAILLKPGQHSLSDLNNQSLSGRSMNKIGG